MASDTKNPAGSVHEPLGVNYEQAPIIDQVMFTSDWEDPRTEKVRYEHRLRNIDEGKPCYGKKDET